MTRRVSAAEAKARLSSLVAEAAVGGQYVVIERRGKPLATLVGIGDLERLEQGRATSSKPRGALSLVGAWKEVPEKRLDALVSQIYEAREKAEGRPVSLDV